MIFFKAVFINKNTEGSAENSNFMGQFEVFRLNSAGLQLSTEGSERGLR